MSPYLSEIAPHGLAPASDSVPGNLSDSERSRRRGRSGIDPKPIPSPTDAAHPVTYAATPLERLVVTYVTHVEPLATRSAISATWVTILANAGKIKTSASCVDGAFDRDSRPPCHTVALGTKAINNRALRVEG